MSLMSWLRLRRAASRAIAISGLYLRFLDLLSVFNKSFSDLSNTYVRLWVLRERIGVFDIYSLNL